MGDRVGLLRTLGRERAKDISLDYGLDPLRPESVIVVLRPGLEVARGPKQAFPAVRPASRPAASAAAGRALGIGMAQGQVRLRERFKTRRRQQAQQAVDKAAAYELVER